MIDHVLAQAATGPVSATWELYLTLVVAGGLLLALGLRLASTELIALTGLAILVLAGDVSGSTLLPTPAEAVAGFGSKSLITIALLFAVVAGLELTGGTTLATGWWLRRAGSLRGAQVRLLLPVAAISGFVNNTPVVAAMLPVVTDLGKRLGESTSRLLLPLSYAAILGGMCTMIGTSTNLVVREMYRGHLAAGGGGDPLSFFSPAVAGLPATILGLAYILAASRWLIPPRSAAVSLGDDPQRYTVEMQVQDGGAVVGQTLQEAGLRSLPGLYVAEIQRPDGTIEPAKPSARLRGGDVLILVGELASVVDLHKIRGLSTPDDQSRKLQIPAWRRTLVEAVVSAQCGLVGKTIREGRFRTNYNAAVVAVARGGRRLDGKLGDVRLDVGDVLLLEASPSFLQRQRGQRDFYMVGAVEGGQVRRHDRAPVAIGIVLAMIVAAATESIEILTAALLSTLAMVALRCCTASEARRSVDWSVLIIIGSMLGIGGAMRSVGADDLIAGGLVSMAGGSVIGTLVAVYVATVICTELVTNSAAAVLMFSIATAAAADRGLPSAEPLVIAVMIAASASFLTPFGYQTNTMVYGIGGYRLGDYLRFGGPLNLIVGVTAITAISFWYKLW